MCQAALPAPSITFVRSRTVAKVDSMGLEPNQPGPGQPKEYPWHLVLEGAEYLLAS